MDAEKGEIMKKRNEAKLFQWGFVIFLAGYALASVVFQVLYPYFSYWPTSVTNEITLDACHSMRMRVPLSVPILYASQGDQAKQITLWVWQTSPSCVPEVKISFSSSEDIIWLDQKGDEVAPSIEVKSGKTETAAPRYFFYIYTPVRSTPNTQFTLNIYLDDQLANHIPLYGQSQIDTLFFGFLYILLGTPSLTMVAGALATGFGVFQTYKNLETIRLQRQKELEADIEKLNRVSGRAAADIGLQYSSLMDHIKKWGFSEDELVLMAAQRVFKTKQDQYAGARIWAFSFRKEITQKLSTDNFKTWLEKANSDIQFLNEDEFQTICYFSKNSGGVSSFEQLLDYGLKAFGILGVDNVDTLCAIIASFILCLDNGTDEENLEKLKNKWFANGASGRYLSGKLADVKNDDNRFIAALKIKLIEWKNNEEYPPNLLGTNAMLWASEPLYTLTHPAEMYLKRYFFKSILWRTPFGPVKAEFDPRLPRQIITDDKRPVKGFFWEEHPIWEKVIGAQSLCVTAGHGMGSSALILMGRHVRRFWGGKPSLSIFLQLHGSAEESIFWSMLEQALFEQLIRDLVEDPFWLLNAPISSQQMIASFLVKQGGDFPALLLKIEEAGLLEKEREVVGLALFDVSDTPVYQSHLQLAELIKVITRAMLDAAHLRMTDDQFNLLLWIEFKSSDGMDGWIELIERSGLNSLAILKLFAPAPLYSMKVRRSFPVENLSWEREQLKEMLVKRIKQTGVLRVEDFPLDELLDKADGSPARLIETANQSGFSGD
jgi:hypothetical protein